MDVNLEVKLLWKLKKKIFRGGLVGGWEVGLGGQGGCEGRSEAFVKIQKKKNFFFFCGGGQAGWMGTDK